MNGTSWYKGVSFNKARGKWHASIMVDYQSIHLGFFKTELEAARAYDEAAMKRFGPFARGNFPGGRS
ncbi:MAG: hypothetical protein GY906_24145 [bacterium]|nr:hypothetical protein [bacterium]